MRGQFQFSQIKQHFMKYGQLCLPLVHANTEIWCTKKHFHLQYSKEQLKESGKYNQSYMLDKTPRMALCIFS